MPSLDGNRLKRVELGVLAAVALGCLAFHLWLPTTFAREDDYQAVAKALAAEAKPGDEVLLFPWWTERARLFLPDGLHVTGYLGSDKDDLEHAARIWVLGEPKLPRADRSGFDAAFLPNRRQLGEPRRFGNLELTLYANGRYRPALFSAADALPTAHVFFEGQGGQRADCQFDGTGFNCPPGDDGQPVRVAAEWHELRYVPRRCVHLHPPGRDIKLVAEFSNVPPGQLVLGAGVIWEHATSTAGTTAYVAAEDAQGRALTQIALPPALDGEQKAEVAFPGASTLRLTSVSEQSRERDVCVELFSYGAAGSM